MFSAYFRERNERLRAYGGAALLLLILILQNLNAVGFNVWNGVFLDALAHAAERPERELWIGLSVLALIAIGDIVLGTTAGFIAAYYTIWWRNALTTHYLPRWEATDLRIEGASQRIQEDPGQLAGIVEGIGLDFFRSALALVTFAPLLYVLGKHITSGWLAWSGSLMVLAIVVSGIGVAASWFFGRRLPKLETEKQVLEAAFRKQLVHGEERRSLLEAGDGWQVVFGLVIENSRRLCRAYYGFAVWATTYDKIMMIIPYAACMHSLAEGGLTFAISVQIVNAFGQVQGGLSFVLKNWTRVTQLRAVYARLRDFEAGLAAPPPETIVVPHPAYAVRETA